MTDTHFSNPHSHVFLGEGHSRNERRTWIVIALTATMMVAEIAAGTIYGSMALTADGCGVAMRSLVRSLIGLGALAALAACATPDVAGLRERADGLSAGAEGDLLLVKQHLLGSGLLFQRMQPRHAARAQHLRR